MTVAVVKSFVSEALETKIYADSTKQLSAVEEKWVKAKLDAIKLSAQGELKRVDKKTTPTKKSTIRRSPELKFDLDRPPDNSRLNFYLLLFQEEENSQERTLYSIAASLMKKLYGQCAFFQKIPHAELLILDQLIAKKEETDKFEYPDELANISIGDEQLQQIFCEMLKGGQTQEGTTYPSLLLFITFDKDYFNKTSKSLKELRGPRTRINFLFAPPPLLDAIFENKRVVDALLTMRSKMWERIFAYEKRRKQSIEPLSLEEKLGRGEITKDLKEQFALILDECQCDAKSYASLFDFTLGDTGHILILTDPITDLLIREKIPKPRPPEDKAG